MAVGGGRQLQMLSRRRAAWGGFLPPEGFIQNAEIQQLLRAQFGLVGDRSSVLTLSPELQPVVVVRDLSSLTSPEASQRRAYGQARVTAVIGQFPYFQMFNPIGSQILALVDEVRFNSASAQAYFLGWNDTQLPTNGGATPQATLSDRRLQLSSAAGSGRHQVQLTAGTQAGVPTTFDWYTWDKEASDGDHILETPGLVLTPGTGLVLRGPGNGSLFGSYVWREAPEKP